MSTSGTDAADLVAATSKYWLVKGSAVGTSHLSEKATPEADCDGLPGSLVCLPFNAPGKKGNKAPAFQAGVAVSDFVVSPFEDLLAVAGEKGEVRPGAPSCAPTDAA